MLASGCFWLLTACCATAAYGGSISSGSSSSKRSEYRLLDANGTECLDADLTGAEFDVPYRCGGVGERLCTADVVLPAANCSVVSGRCENRTARLAVTWSAGRFQLELIFRQRSFESVMSQIKKETVTYGYLSDMRLIADLRDPAFVNASFDKDQSRLEFSHRDRDRGLLVFAAPAGSAFVCRSPEAVRLRPRRGADRQQLAAADAVATFPAVRLTMSLGAAGGEKVGHDGDFLCEADSNRQRTGIAALVIAGVIGVSMLVIVVGYLATRLRKNSRYSNME